MGRLKQPPETSTYTFINVNPRNIRAGDCVVRAIALATSQSWDDVLEGLFEVAKKVKAMPNDTVVYEKYLSQLGWVKQPAPKKADNHRYTGKEFAKLNKKMTAICHIGSHHLTALKNGKFHDIWDCTDGAVGNLWIKEEK